MAQIVRAPTAERTPKGMADAEELMRVEADVGSRTLNSGSVYKAFAKTAAVLWQTAQTRDLKDDTNSGPVDW